MGKAVTLGSVNRSATNLGKRSPNFEKSVTQTWVLKSGAKATFIEKTLSYEELRDNTFVNFDHNGRDQDLLTIETIARLKSLDNQQYYPAIAIEKDGGQLEILDGSTRRAYILSKEGVISTFRVMVTRQTISTADAKALAKEIQTAIEHNLYEIGQRAKPLAESGMSQRSIALELGHSQRKIHNSLQTTVITKPVMKLFPVANDISWPTYKLLIDLMPRLPELNDGFTLDGEPKDIDEIIERLEVLALPKQESNKKKENKPTYTSIPLIEFDKGIRKKANKKISSDSSRVIYDFDRLGSKANSIVDSKIQEAMDEINRLMLDEE